MVGLDGVDHAVALPVFPGQLHANLDVGAFHLVVDGLAQVVKQARALGHSDVGADLSSQQSGHVAHLNGVVQHVLAVAGAVFHAAQELDELGVEAVDVGLEHSPLALGLDGGVHLPLGLLHHLLNAGGVDAAVLDELFQRQPGDLPAHRVEAGHGDGLGGIVNDEVHPGEGLQGADVAALPTDNAALEVVIGQRHHRHGGLSHVVGGATLDGEGNDLLGSGVRLFLGPGLDLLNLQGGLVGDLLLQLGQQDVLGLLGGHAGNALQLTDLLVLQLGQFLALGVQGLLLGGQGFFLMLQVFQLAVQVFFFLIEAVFLLLQLGAALLDLGLVLGAGLQDLLLGLYQRLALLALGGLDGVVNDALGLFLRAGDLLFGDPLAVLHAHREPDGEKDHGANHAD